jgi:hypothetical protein
MKPWLVVGLVATLATSAASAETIDYTITGDTSGTFTNAAGKVSDFTDVPVTVVAVGDTSTQFDYADASLVLLSSVTVIGGGLTRSIDLGAGTYFAVPNPPLPDPGPATFVTVVSGIPVDIGYFAGNGLSGYNGVSDIGPLAVDFQTPIGPLMLGNDTVEVADFTDATFSASLVPEPGAWAMMLTGIAAAGAGLRRRRALA